MSNRLISRSSDQVKKEVMVTELKEARTALLAAVTALPPPAWDIRFLGVWSAHDIVAHLVGWDAANLYAIRAIVQGRLPAFYAQYDTDWRTFNAELVTRHKRPTLEETLRAVQASHRDLLQAVDALPADELMRDHGVRSPRGRKVTVAMLLSAEAGDERKHSEQIRAFATQLQGGA
jgi:uncharacterized damage-inducible protein DinB